MSGLRTATIGMALALLFTHDAAALNRDPDVNTYTLARHMRTIPKFEEIEEQPEQPFVGPPKPEPEGDYVAATGGLVGLGGLGALTAGCVMIPALIMVSFAEALTFDKEKEESKRMRRKINTLFGIGLALGGLGLTVAIAASGESSSGSESVEPIENPAETVPPPSHDWLNQRNEPGTMLTLKMEF